MTRKVDKLTRGPECESTRPQAGHGGPHPPGSTSVKRYYRNYHDGDGVIRKVLVAASCSRSRAVGR